MNTSGHDEHARELSQLHRLAQQHQDATWGATDSEATVPSTQERARTGIPGASLLAGDIGPKAQVSGALRNLSLEQRRSRGRVSRGTSMPGGGLLIAASFGTVIAAAVAGLVLIAWLVS